MDSNTDEDVSGAENVDQAPTGSPTKEASIETMTNNTVASPENEKVGRKHHHRHKHSAHEAPTHLPEIHPQHNHPEWLRHFDQQQNIYYVHNVTGESAWLQPCCMCDGPSDRWCIDCKRPYCDHDFHKKHGKTEIREKHKWQFKELQEVAPLQPGDEYCIACKRKAAFKMCMDCWEPFCLTCYSLVHHVGGLKVHKAMPFRRAKTGWTAKRDYTNNTETYIHGETGETTTEKPYDLYSEEEKIMQENVKSYEAALQQHQETIEKLKAELAVVTKERDRAVVETSQAVNEMRARVEAKEKQAIAAATKSKKLGLSSKSQKP